MLETALLQTSCTANLTVLPTKAGTTRCNPTERCSRNAELSRKGNCFDNVAIENFFDTLKAEYFHLEKPDSVNALEAGVHDYVHYYNRERIKLRLQGLSPVEYQLRITA